MASQTDSLLESSTPLETQADDHRNIPTADKQPISSAASTESKAADNETPKNASAEKALPDADDDASKNVRNPAVREDQKLILHSCKDILTMPKQERLLNRTRTPTRRPSHVYSV